MAGSARKFRPICFDAGTKSQARAGAWFSMSKSGTRRGARAMSPPIIIEQVWAMVRVQVISARSTSELSTLGGTRGGSWATSRRRHHLLGRFSRSLPQIEVLLVWAQWDRQRSEQDSQLLGVHGGHVQNAIRHPNLRLGVEQLQ